MSSVYSDHNLPLDPESRWIRVFDIYPAHHATEEPIRGQLRIVRLDDNPSYSALSYAWGDFSTSRQIECKAGQSLPVRTNCYDALLQLRHSFRTRTLWVDSICIDQENDEEKSHEVSLMRDIFNQARRVYIWLGKGTQKSDYAMDWLANATLDISVLDSARVAPFPEFLRPRDMSRLLRMTIERTKNALYQKALKSSKASYDPEAMQDLSSREWFKRVWTFQELVMAREPVVICGSKSIRWNNLFWGMWSAQNLADDTEYGNSFSEVCDSALVAYSFWHDNYIISEFSKAPIRKWLLHGQSPELYPARDRLLRFLGVHGWKVAKTQIFGIVLVILVRIYYGLRPLNSLGVLFLTLSAIATLLLTPSDVFQDHERRVRHKLVGMLNRTRARQATRQVDRVFALYGVLRSLGAPLQKPDYGKSVGEVYTEFTRAMINWHKSLDILTEASTPAFADAPSWVPDWSTRYHLIFRSDSSAARDSSARYSFSACGRKLHTSGMLVDTVLYCTELLKEPRNAVFSGGTCLVEPEFLSQSLHNIRILTEWFSHARKIFLQTNEVFLEALFKAIHSETDFQTKNESTLREMFNKWYAILTLDYSEFSTTCTPDVACALAISANESINHYHHERCRTIADKRRFFTTSKGHIGTGPPCMRITDRVAILSGLRAPLILREVGPHHEVVGAAYVHGIMYGEAWLADESQLLQLTFI